MQALRQQRYATYAQEADNYFVRTEETQRVMRATGLQMHLVKCVNLGYLNLISQGDGSDHAIKKTADYIDSRNKEALSQHEDYLDSCVRKLAALDRGEIEEKPEEIDGIPVISQSSILIALGKTPPSPEVEREEARDWLQNEILIRRLRIERLKFEWLSSKALVEILRKNI